MGRAITLGRGQRRKHRLRAGRRWSPRPASQRALPGPGLWAGAQWGQRTTSPGPQRSLGTAEGGQPCSSSQGLPGTHKRVTGSGARQAGEPGLVLWLRDGTHGHPVSASCLPGEETPLDTPGSTLYTDVSVTPRPYDSLRPTQCARGHEEHPGRQGHCFHPDPPQGPAEQPPGGSGPGSRKSSRPQPPVGRPSRRGLRVWAEAAVACEGLRTHSSLGGDQPSKFPTREKP